MAKILSHLQTSSRGASPTVILSEGAVPLVRWTLRATAPPSIVRRCPRCDGPRPFQSTRAFRVNAHRRRLDVWLLLRCEACGRSARLPVLERTPVDRIDPQDLRAFTDNDPARCDMAALAHGLRVPWALQWTAVAPPFVAHVALLDGARVRLDRLLAAALGRSRSVVARDLRTGGLRLITGSAGPTLPDNAVRASKRPVRDGQRIAVLR